MPTIRTLLYAAGWRRTIAAMAKKTAPPIEVICPCCQSRLTVDTQLAVVLAHVAPPKAAPDVDISDSARILADQAQRREDKFRDSWEAEHKKEDVLARKFEEALKKAKEQPVRKACARFRPLIVCATNDSWTLQVIGLHRKPNVIPSAARDLLC